MRKRMDLVGEIYGKLIVKSFSHTTQSNRMSNYLCECTCGTLRTVSHGNLRSGHTKSCGCLPTGKITHGKSNSGSKAYTSWRKIKERCHNPNDISYFHYGAKGVTMSQAFYDDFPAFLVEVGEPPTKGEWTIDRIDNALGYQPGNLRWATKTQQARNKKKRVDNKTGVTGLQFYHSGVDTHATYAVATWYDLQIGSTPKNKKFSVRKYGLLPAFKMAFEYRRKMIEELNAAGAGYTATHGQ